MAAAPFRNALRDAFFLHDDAQCAAEAAKRRKRVGLSPREFAEWEQSGGRAKVLANIPREVPTFRLAMVFQMP